MKTIGTSGSLKSYAFGLLATVSLLGNHVTAAEPGSDAQQQARDLLSGRSAAALTSHSVSVGAIALSSGAGRSDAQSQARAILAPNAEGLGQSASTNSAESAIRIVKGTAVERLARNRPDAQEAARRLLDARQTMLD